MKALFTEKTASLMKALLSPFPANTFTNVTPIDTRHSHHPLSLSLSPHRPLSPPSLRPAPLFPHPPPPTPTSAAALTLSELVLRSAQCDGVRGGVGRRHLHEHAGRLQDLGDVVAARADQVLVLRLAHLDADARAGALHLLVDVDDLLLGLHHALLLAGDGQLVLHHRQRRDVDPDARVLRLQPGDVLVVGATDERVVLLRHLQLLVRLL